jgi:hypothetical protein
MPVLHHLGRIAYEAWAQTVGDGTPWDALTNRDQDGWQRAAIAARDASIPDEPSTGSDLSTIDPEPAA